jgi:N6-L-threonylcarbamoyladenine synthase
VGVSFAKSFGQALKKPLIEVNHLQAHVLSHFIQKPEDAGKMPAPQFPFICLLVSGGHTQILLLHSHFDMEILGQTIDDAAGEAIDKAAKIMDLGYPGGPIIDRLAKEGNPDAYHFATPHIAGNDYSFSGIKTSFLYFLRDRIAENPNYIEEHKADLCASIQKCIVGFLIKKLEKAVKESGVRQIAIAGGVSANSLLRSEVERLGQKHHWKVFIPKFQFCTDNAAMVGIAGYFKYLQGEFADLGLPPYAR